MTCAESRDLMLMRKSELTREQENQLRGHFKTCADCAAYLQENKDAMRRMEALRAFEPVLKNAQDLTSDILNAVESARRGATQAAASSSGRVFQILSYRTMRILYGTFVLGSVGLFLAQQLAVATDVQSLEEKLAQRRGGKAGIQVMYSVPSNLVNRLPKSKQILSYLGTADAGERDGLFVIDGSSLSRAVDVVGSVIFRSTDAFSDDVSRKKLEALAETIQRSVSARVTIRSKERS